MYKSEFNKYYCDLQYYIYIYLFIRIYGLGPFLHRKQVIIWFTKREKK